MVFVSVFVFRKRYPDVRRPYRAWMYPWSVYIILAVYAVFFVITIWTALIPSLIGLALTATGAPYYYFKVVRPGRRASGAV